MDGRATPSHSSDRADSANDHPFERVDAFLVNKQLRLEGEAHITRTVSWKRILVS